jgi:hypothetical protein
VDRAISCRIFDAHFAVLGERGIDPGRLVEGSPVSVGFLCKGGNWISWAVYVGLMRRYVELVGPGAAEITARHFLDSSALGFVRALGGLFVDLNLFYQFCLRAAAQTAFPVARAEVDLADGRELCASLLLPERLEDCPFFFEVTSHVLRFLPAFLGQEHAEVRMELMPRRAVFHILLPPSRTALARVRRTVAALLHAQAPALIQMAGAAQDLAERLGEVSATHDRLEELSDALAQRMGASADAAADHDALASYHAEMARIASGRLQSLGQDYRRELREELERLQRKNSRFSLRAFARKLGLSPGMLSNVLAGKRNLSVEVALQVAQRLGYSPAETRRFCQLVHLSNIADPELKAILGA